MTETTAPTGPTGDPIRIVLIGSERVTRAGLRMLIESQPGLRVIGEVESSIQFTAEWTRPPHVAVIDLDRHGSLELVSSVREASRGATRIIVLTSTPESDACAEAIQRGVLGIVSKQQAPEVLIKAIERVHAGEVWLNRAKIAGVLGKMRASAAARKPQAVSRPEALSSRERQIITLVGQGFRNNEIASTIFVSEATVRNCLGAIFRKLGVTNRVHLMIYAIREGFVSVQGSGDQPPGAVSPRDVLRLATLGGRPLDEPGQS